MLRKLATEPLGYIVNSLENYRFYSFYVGLYKLLVDSPLLKICGATSAINGALTSVGGGRWVD